jgi:hypothetical protein
MARKIEALTAKLTKDIREEREEEPYDSNYKGRFVDALHLLASENYFARQERAARALKHDCY